MSDYLDSFKYEKICEDNDSQVRQKNWNAAFGLQAVDGLKPSEYMVSLAAANVKGEKTYEQVCSEIFSYYSSVSSDKPVNTSEREADLVSSRIYELLADPSFTFSPQTLKAYHKHLFFGIDIGISGKYIGEFRDYNISKKEPILNGKSVQYASFFMITDTLKYDFEEEKGRKYVDMTDLSKIQHISEFTSRVWQVHAFAEGNTRTTAVFIQKYLNNLGFDVNNELFKDNSTYFRNALVRANYSSIQEGINADRKYLDDFFKVLLGHETLVLDNNALYLSNTIKQEKPLRKDLAEQQALCGGVKPHVQSTAEEQKVVAPQQTPTQPKKNNGGRHI